MPITSSFLICITQLNLIYKYNVISTCRSVTTMRPSQEMLGFYVVLATCSW